MDTTWKPLLWLQAGAAALATLWDDFSAVHQTLLMVMGLDVISAWIAVTVRGRFDATALKRGLVLKVATLIAVSIAHLLEQRMGLPVSTAVAGAFVLGEVASAFRNLARAGVKLPAPLLRIVSSLQEQQEGELEAQERKLAKRGKDSYTHPRDND